jgi:hypothetical protein
MKHFSAFSLALLSTLLASQAVAEPLDDAIALFRRQSVSPSGDTSGGSDSDSSDVVSTTSAVRTSSSVVQTTSAPQTTSSRTPSTTVVVTTSTRPATTSQESSEESQSSESSAETEESTRITTSVPIDIVTTFTTISNGQTQIGTRTSQTLVPTETEVDPSSLSGGGSSGGSSGLSNTAKKTIGGVVGGVGGALLLAGLGYTAWRIWGKKRNLHDEDAYDPNMAQDKLSSSTEANSTPFNRTLDQYHQPGPVNTASNF